MLKQAFPAVGTYNYTALSRKIESYWMPDGKSVNKDNETKINSCMTKNQIAGSIPFLINAGTESTRAQSFPA